MRLEAVRRDDFARRLHASWCVRDHADAALTLDDVSPVAITARWESFALRFVGTSDAPLAQGTYVLEDDELGSLELFLVPLGPDADGGPRYECVFNRAASDANAGG